VSYLPDAHSGTPDHSGGPAPIGWLPSAGRFAVRLVTPSACASVRSAGQPPGRVRRAVGLVAAALLAAGGFGAPGRAAPAEPPVPGSSHPAIRARDHDHDDQPHTTELEFADVSSTETEVDDRHVLVLDHPKYGLLNGKNYLGYCDSCPIATMGTGTQCAGPCPGEQPILSHDA